jgi:hypothetical protein
MDDKEAIRKVKGITFTQILLTLTRLLTAYAAGVALPYSVALNQFGDSIDTDDSIPFWIALGAFCAAVGATVFFFIVEYVVRYNLSHKLGEYVCEAFRDEIENMYTVLSVPNNDIDTKQVQEREAWEYVALSHMDGTNTNSRLRLLSLLQYRVQYQMDNGSPIFCV